MKKIPHQEYTAEFKDLGLVEQTLRNGVKALAAGKLAAPGAKPVTPEQMELSRLRAESARRKLHVDILRRRRGTASAAATPAPPRLLDGAGFMCRDGV